MVSDLVRPVLHLVPSLEIGGMERMVASLASKRPDTARVLCLDDYGSLGKDLLTRGHSIDSLSQCSTRASLLFRLRHYLVTHDIRILHAHNLKAFTYAAAAALTLRRVRLVLTKHGMRTPSRYRLGEALRRFAAHRSALVGVSREICEQLRTWAGLSSEQVTLIENGTDPQKPSAPRDVLRRQLGIPTHTIAVACVARLAKEKDHATLLNAFFKTISSAQRCNTNPSLRLLLVGDGPLRGSLISMAKHLGISAAVEFLGERDDVADIFAAADLAVLSSRTEGLPLTLLEAMMQRTPVVATAVGDIPTLIQHDAGRLVIPGSPSELASAISQAIANRTEAMAMAEVAYRRVRGSFSLDATWKKYQSLYQQLETN